MMMIETVETAATAHPRVSTRNVGQDDQQASAPADPLANIRPGLYGWGRFHPQWLQTFNKPGCLLACFCFAVFSSTLSGALMPAVTDTLERRFHLNSVMSGLMNSSYDIASLLIVLFVCHYGERGHKGRWISIGAIVYGIGSCIITIPHFVAEPYHADSWYNNHSDTCPADVPQNICGADDSHARNASWSYYILLAGQAVRGFGGTCLGTLMLSYIDENVTQRESPLYLSIISVVGIVAMALGFLVGGQFLHLYGDFDKVPREKWPKRWDPDWYGCWWMGYYIGGISAFIVSVPLLGFPKELPSKLKARQADKQQSHGEGDRVTGTGFAANWSELPRATLSLLKNPVFTCFTIRTTLEVIFGSGWGVFMPKYLQNMYGMDPGFSAMIAGAISLGPIMGGTLFGGWIIKKFNWKVRGVLFFGFIATAIGSFSCLGILFTCKTRPTMGANIDYSGKLIPKNSGSLWNSCNANCSCDATDYVPVCFQEMGITYYSPCFAGCSRSDETKGPLHKYSECRCPKSNFPMMVNANSSVTMGECPQTSYCISQRNWFIGTWVITCLMFGMSGMPLVQSFLRAVPFTQRTLALGLQSIPLRMLGTVPGPILMGLMFDYSCILWKTYCGEKLSCLLYDNETIVMLIVFVGVFIRIASCGLLLTAIILYRPPKPAAAVTNADGIPADPKMELNEGSIFDMIIARIRSRIRGYKESAMHTN